MFHCVLVLMASSVFYSTPVGCALAMMSNSSSTVEVSSVSPTLDSMSTTAIVTTMTAESSVQLSTKSIQINVQTTQAVLPTTSSVPQSTTGKPSELERFWNLPLNRYLVFGGAGCVCLIILLILLACAICVVKRMRHKHGVYSNKGDRDQKRYHSTDRSDLALLNVTTLEQDFDESELIQEKTVSISEFTEHVHKMRMHANSGFENDFDTLAKITKKKPPYSFSQLRENEMKNRFDNVFPYDSSRVVLSKVDDIPGSDYINASYIDGYDRTNAYIAAQGPLRSTVSDFWRMIWEFNLTTVIMLTETMEAGKEKCERYWPTTPNEPWDVGYNLKVTLAEQIPFAEYKVKIFKIENKMDPESCVPLIVTHYHFSAWPDHGVPADKTSLIHFIQRVRRHHSYFNSPPLLVHCSAGVGRTGTFITLDSMIQRMKNEDTLDIFAFVRKMRSCRPLMVQTEEQYVFIHEALEEFITCGDTSIGVANLRIAIAKLNKPCGDNSDTQFNEQFKLLGSVSCQPTSINCTEGKKAYNAKKNRYPDRVPYNTSRVSLKQSGVKGSDYINASFIDGYKQQRALIATQTPLRSTVNEFWRMVWECQSRAIVMLTNLEEEEGEDQCVYWPKEENSAELYGKLKVTLLNEELVDNLTVRKIELREDTQYHIPGVIDYLVVTQIQHNGWQQIQLPSIKSVLSVMDMLLKIQRSTGNHAITVVCNDGMGRTGTFVCIYSQLERMKTESVCDVFQCVKAMRLQRPSMVLSVEQLTFCYQALADYLDMFERYANFK